MQTRNKILLWTLILWYPPIHEIGHVIIAACLRQKLYVVTWNFMTIEKQASHWPWDVVTAVIPFVALLLVLYYYYKNQSL